MLDLYWLIYLLLLVFFLSVKLSFFPTFLIHILIFYFNLQNAPLTFFIILDRVFLVIDFDIHYFEYSLQFPSGLKIFSVVKSADSPMGASLHVPNCFSLATFKILSLNLTFSIIILVCLGVDLSWFFLLGTLHWTSMSISFSRLGTFSGIIS